jgi:hypothetical protein
MTWDMVLVTVTLFSVLLLMILFVLVSLIWQDQAPRKRENDSRHAQTLASRPPEPDKVSGHESSLA